VDSEFESVATQLLKRTQAMLNKYRSLLIEDAMVRHITQVHFIFIGCDCLFKKEKVCREVRASITIHFVDTIYCLMKVITFCWYYLLPYEGDKYIYIASALVIAPAISVANLHF